MHPGYQIGTLYLHCEPIDFRKQINSLSALVESERKYSVITPPLPSLPFCCLQRQSTSL